ncbi:MAG TPA: enolase C-terminal domain-like protein [Bryobacteraceae bacterium]|nr:enolase C-terminal domain-like protein [Bryobacteraceae bacterium]
MGLEGAPARYSPCFASRYGSRSSAGLWQRRLHRRMLECGAVDVLQADATRCGGITGFLAAGALAEAASMPLSAHTSPTLHGHAGCGVRPMLNVEYFHDHARIEQMLFDGALRPVHGLLRPDLSRPGLGLEFKRQDAAPYLIYQHETRGE